MTRALVGMTLLFCACSFRIAPFERDASAVTDGGLDLAVVVDDLATLDIKPTLDLTGYDGPPAGKIGYPCLTAQECDTGLCVDGYCCDTLCDPFNDANKCRACNVPGAEGHCVLALDGTDPRGRCAQDAPETCLQDGLCDGQGQCRKWVANTQCGPPVCTAGSNTITYAPACDGNGHCSASAVSTTCFPYTCQTATACSISCGGGTGSCANGANCSSGSCGQKMIGQPCSDPSECITAQCAQGVCCSSACSGNCQSCALPGHVGICTPAAAGTDPLNQCTATAREGCGLDGTCDGAGGCRNWKAGTPCAWPSCMNDALLSARACDGVGSCQQATSTPCGNYSCDPYAAVCRTTCQSNGDCAQGKTCDIPSSTCH